MTIKRKLSLLTAGILILVAAVFGVMNANAQTASPYPTNTTTPGMPTTGAGGNATMNLVTLIGSAVISGAGITYLSRRRGAVR